MTRYACSSECTVCVRAGLVGLLASGPCAGQEMKSLLQVWARAESWLLGAGDEPPRVRYSSDDNQNCRYPSRCANKARSSMGHKTQSQQVTKMAVSCGSGLGPRSIKAGGQAGKQSPGGLSIWRWSRRPVGRGRRHAGTPSGCCAPGGFVSGYA